MLFRTCAAILYLNKNQWWCRPTPPCSEEADIEASGGIDISDLVYLVDYMFTGGPPPPSCP
ncbi:MAG: hypothetical protein OEV49_00060 [candidate division Zixibacteria bacterium]|nr:hypothetical protein [candidate division Zixibacteria bacterium]MDH3937232.1 hypothetical protein [candidate division Zixibacteria bacterium]MDH4035079.1 hypothetical protein [candidate division Zixibacteria bacterium]